MTAVLFFLFTVCSCLPTKIALRVWAGWQNFIYWQPANRVCMN